MEINEKLGFEGNRCFVLRRTLLHATFPETNVSFGSIKNDWNRRFVAFENRELLRELRPRNVRKIKYPDIPFVYVRGDTKFEHKQ